MTPRPACIPLTSTDMPRWLLPLVLALLTASSTALALRLPGAEGGSGPGEAALRAPVLSARRAPGLVSRLVADTRLRSDLDAALAGPSLGSARSRSCLVVRQGRRPIFERRPHQDLIPASTLKVLTGHAVLTRLGPDERLVTEVKTVGPVGRAGVVDGPLWLVGGGDPLLSTADFVASAPPDQPLAHTALEALADAVVTAGVRQVSGGVMGDETRYDTQRYVPTWKPSYAASGHVGPASALSLNHGFAHHGPVPVPAPQPDAHAAAVLTNLLRARGVAVAGPPGEGVAPPGSTVVARLPSLPMREVVAQMLRDSDNLTAELLVKELGRRFANAGTTTAGLGVVRQTLATSGLPVAELKAVDGSGLDRGDRASCALLMAALESSGPSGAIASGFPVAARTGTLARRFLGHPAAGRLRAKTGSLDNVAGLTGYISLVGGEGELEFALLANDLPGDGPGRALQEQLGTILARYPQAPAPATLAP